MSAARTLVRTAALVVLGAAAVHAAARAGAEDAAVLGTGETTTAPHGAFTIRWTTTPAPLPTNEPFELDVEVTAAAEVAGDRNPIWLNLNARMPAHAHGMNTRPKVLDLGNGHFVVRGMLLHMAGDWELTFDVAKGRTREQATVTLSLD